MLQAKKRATSLTRGEAPAPLAYRKHLEHLYARRSTIDALIESLMAYEVSRSKRLDPRRRKSA